MSAKRNHSLELQVVVSQFSETLPLVRLPLVPLLLLRMVDKQLRSEITARMIADALQRKFPTLVGLPLDKPIDFYMEIWRSYCAKCTMSRTLVFHFMTIEATSHFDVKMGFVTPPGDRPKAAARLLVERLGSALHSREGRSFALDAVLELRDLTRTLTHGLVFHDGAIAFLSTMERLLRTVFVVVDRRITTGEFGAHW